MKKLFSLIAVMFVMAAVPEVTHATEPCQAIVLCDHIVVVCNWGDWDTWADIYCDPITD
jgi:hypothetical protein